MRYKTIGVPGSAELKASAVGVGCNAFGARCDEAVTTAIIDAALEAGINFLDTSNSYSMGTSEEFVGRALKGRRGDVLIASKFGMHEGAAPEMAAKSVEESLTRLQTDHIDLYQLHRPDPSVPIAETLGAMARLIEQGKVRAIGCSNFSCAQLAEAVATARDMGIPGFVTAQNAYSLLQRDIESDLVPVCREHGIGILPYYPIFRGMLSGKYRRGEPAPAGTRLAGGGRGAEFLKDDAVFDTIDALTKFAEDRGHTILELAIAWLACQDTVPCVISGASKPEQVAANARAADWLLDAEDLAAIDAIVPPPG